MTPDGPPSFVIRTEAQKAASENGYRLERGIEGGWLQYASTTARGSIWIAHISDNGPWLLSIGHSGVAAEMSDVVANPLQAGDEIEHPGISAISKPLTGIFAQPEISERVQPVIDGHDDNIAKL